MKRILLGLFAVAAIALALVLVLNQIDESLKPEVSRILDKKPNPTEAQLQAYGFLKEHYAEFKGAGSVDCGEADVCSSQTLKEKPELRKALEKNKVAIDNYVKLMEFGDIASGFTPSPEQPLSGISMVPANIHSFFLLQLGAWREKSGGVRVADLITSSNRYFRKVMEDGTLLERMIAAMLMKRNALFLAQEIKAQPAFRQQMTPELIKSFSTPEGHDILSGAIEDELRVLSAFVHSKSKDRFDLETSSADWWEIITLRNQQALNLRLFLLPNATLNAYYVLANESLATDCPMVEEKAEYKCLPSWEKINPKWPWQRLINPTGRYFVELVGAGYVRRKQKLDEMIKQIYTFRQSLER